MTAFGETQFNNSLFTNEQRQGLDAEKGAEVRGKAMRFSWFSSLSLLWQNASNT